ncbi:MAG: hypothetical protein R3290_12865 [Acidimicrobiia bacterium]|nr:hypothetical protein [Acidimicrobiia bacterium]
MQITVWSGQAVPRGGWFLDGHGHRLFLRAGDLAPICPAMGPAAVAWRLVREIPTVPADPRPVDLP